MPSSTQNRKAVQTLPLHAQQSGTQCLDGIRKAPCSHFKGHSNQSKAVLRKCSAGSILGITCPLKAACQGLAHHSFGKSRSYKAAFPLWRSWSAKVPERASRAHQFFWQWQVHFGFCLQTALQKLPAAGASSPCCSWHQGHPQSFPALRHGAESELQLCLTGSTAPTQMMCGCSHLSSYCLQLLNAEMPPHFSRGNFCRFSQ